MAFSSSPALLPLWRMTKQQTIGATLQSATEWIFIPTTYSTGITILCFFTSRRIFWSASFGNELFDYSKEFSKFHSLLCRTLYKYPLALFFIFIDLVVSPRAGLTIFYVLPLIDLCTNRLYEK